MYSVSINSLDPYIPGYARICPVYEFIEIARPRIRP